CSVAAPSTTCTSSSPFGCRSQAPLPLNLALKRFPSRNGESVAKAPLALRSSSSISGRRSCSRFSLPSSVRRLMTVITGPSVRRSAAATLLSPADRIIPPHFDFSYRQNRDPSIRLRIMANGNGATAIDWDDARIFLAVARHGSLRSAGRALGLSQPTIGRRLAAFEAAFGGPAL